MNIWALGNKVVSDGIYWPQAEITSVLRDWLGRPREQAVMAERYGRAPVVAGLRRSARRFSLETHFLSEATKTLRRAAFLQALDPDSEEPQRMIAVDYVPPMMSPDHTILALGPWDAYGDANGDWHCRDLLNPDTIELDFIGGVQFVEGRSPGARAIPVRWGWENEILNPSFEVNVTDGWTNVGFNTFERSSDQAWVGQYSLHCVSDNTGDNAICDTVTEVDTGEWWLASCYVYLVSGDFKLTIEEYLGGWSDATSTTADTGLLNQWQHVYVSVKMSTGVTEGRIRISPDATAASEFYVDGAQFAAGPYWMGYVDGTLGPGFVWDTPTPHNDLSERIHGAASLDDHADLISEQPALSFRFVVQAPYDADGDWSAGSSSYIFDARGASNNHRIGLLYTCTFTDSFDVYINGDYRLESAAQTFDAGDWLEVVVTFDFANDSYVLYVNGEVADTDTTSLDAPTLTTFQLGGEYDHVSPSGWIIEQVQVFDRVLTAAEVSDMYGNHLGARWVNVICEACDPWTVRGKTTDLAYVATMLVDGDRHWRTREGGYFWQVWDDTGVFDLDVESDADVYPTLHIIPLLAKSSGFGYRRWVPIVWKTDAATNYPTDLGDLDTASLIPAKMQADGDDLRVYDGAVEIDRWIQDIDTASTDIWVALDWETEQSVLLGAAIGAGDTITTITAAADISGFPDEGILLIDSEAFTYQGKNLTDKQFLNVVRAARGTSAAAHDLTDTIYWIQHDLWIFYGDSTLTAPVTDDDYKPIVELDTSNNDSWVYEQFGEDDKPRAGSWIESYGDATNRTYTDNHAGDTSPWAEIGVMIGGGTSQGHLRFSVYNVCGITNANFGASANCEQYYASPVTGFQYVIESSENGVDWTTEYSVPLPGSADNWETWTRNEAITAGAKYVALGHGGTTVVRYGEAPDVTLTLDTTYTPDATINSEQNNYPLDVTITNTTTGDAIQVTTSVVLDDVVEVDTDEKTVINITEGSNLFGALTQVGGVRRHWLKLVPGENTLQWDDTGTELVQVYIVADRRSPE